MAHRREHGIFQTSKKMIAAHVILKNLLALDIPNDQMVESARHVKAGFSAHGGTVPETFFLVNLQTYVPLSAIRLNRRFTQNRFFTRKPRRLSYGLRHFPTAAPRARSSWIRKLLTGERDVRGGSLNEAR
jgi:hypothetical protein